MVPPVTSNSLTPFFIFANLFIYYGLSKASAPFTFFLRNVIIVLI